MSMFQAARIILRLAFKSQSLRAPFILLACFALDEAVEAELNGHGEAEPIPDVNQGTSLALLPTRLFFSNVLRQLYTNHSNYVIPHFRHKNNLAFII